MGCLTATLERGVPVVALVAAGEEPGGESQPVVSLTTSVPVAVLYASEGASATLERDAVVVSLLPTVCDATLSLSCPIDYITSCFGLGVWYNALGWDNDNGWADLPSS